MATYIQKSTGAAFSEAAYIARVANGANANDFTKAGSVSEAAAQAAASRALGPDEASIYLPTGASFSAGARVGWISTGRAKPSDFGPVPNTAPAAVATPTAPTPVISTPVVAPAGVAATSFRLGGLELSPSAAGNYVARGLCKNEDLIPVYPPGSGVTAPASTAPSNVLPLDADAYTKAQLVTIAEALGLDASGNKNAIVDAINTLGNEAGTATALAAL